MIRLFDTHKIRQARELSDALWCFEALAADGTADASRMVMVPSCWETYPGYENYRGKARYSRSFEGAGDMRLVFQGVSHTAEVFVDGKLTAKHYNAYTPFEAILQDLQPGQHRLEVLVDNSFGEASALHVENDYQSYGGISRGVVLEELPKHYIRSLHMTPYNIEGTWYLRVNAVVSSLEKEAASGALVLTMKQVGSSEEEYLGTLEVRGEAAAGEFRCENVLPWSPAAPCLYQLTAVLKNADGQEIDDCIDRFGFREVRVEGKQILMNGEALAIRGFCRHEDHPQFGCALPLSAIWADLQIAKDLGANSIRTSHYPNDQLMLDLCDELGILVWEENHARGLSEEQMRNPNFEKQCEDCICEMIEAHYNHPSIYIWGILNECASDTIYGRECYEKQLTLIRQLDASRPRSFASCRFKTDICFDLVDVVSYNIYPKWYHDTPVSEYLDDLYQWIQNETEGRDKPFLITEVGAGAIYGYRTPAKVKWSEEYQAEALQEQLEAILSYGDCSGVYIWQFCDVRITEGGWFASRPRTMNNKGIVDEYRRPKLAYETVKALFQHFKGISEE